MSISKYEYLSILRTQQTARRDIAAAPSDYLEILDSVRTTIARNHAEELAGALGDANAAQTLKALILKYASESISGRDYDRDALVERIYQDMAGMGVLTRYLYDPDVEEININRYDFIEIMRPDRVDFLYDGDAFASADAALNVVKRMVRMGGGLLDAQTPRVNSFIGKGTRIMASIPPIIEQDLGVIASIRKQRKERITRDMLLRAGTATEDMLDFLTLCLCNKTSVGIAGGTGSGKSALEGFLANEYITHNEDFNNRVYVIEDTRELVLLEWDVEHDRPARVVSTATSDGPAKVTMLDLVTDALRYHPNLIIPAEVRDGVAYEAASAGRSGHTILTSFHADGAQDSYRRLVTLCHMAGLNLSDRILLDDCIAAWPIVVHMKQLKDKTRKITEIFEATGQKNGQVVGNTLYRYVVEDTERDGRGNITKVHGRHERTGSISPQLRSKLRDNGAPEELLKRLFPDTRAEGAA